jgi:hypothetical protein
VTVVWFFEQSHQPPCEGEGCKLAATLAPGFQAPPGFSGPPKGGIGTMADQPTPARGHDLARFGGSRS